MIKKYVFFIALFCFSIYTGFCLCHYQYTHKRNYTPVLNPIQQHLNIGITYIRYGQQSKIQKKEFTITNDYYLKAHKHFKKALRIEPHCPQAYYYIGITFHEQNNNKQALQYLQKVITIDQNYVEAYLYTAQILVEEKKFDQAIYLYKKILNQQPDNSTIQVQLNRIYTIRNKYLT